MRFIYLFLVLVVLSSCEKNTPEGPEIPEVTPEKAIIPDSVSFLINGKTYVFIEKNVVGQGNRQINIKRSDTVIPNRKFAYKTGGYFWYGEPDSVLYDRHYEFTSEVGSFTVSFNKKYDKSQMYKGAHLYVPLEKYSYFKEGMQPFSVDLNLENTMEGVAVEFFNHSAFNSVISSYIPAFSVVVRGSLTTNIQNDSRFEIISIKKVDDKYCIIEAKFELNLFDKDEKSYRLEKGFLRITATKKEDVYLEFMN